LSYQSLYRRRRPLTFADMIGQEHITQTLRNALLQERLAHAYLFCGPRGTGKTTAAKIFARAMNCAKYPTDEPCGKCSSCQNIYAGVSIDVIEMDAASNRGIDEIRDLRERTRFASGESRFKVYIIDEAHMLTPEAANAFLKTLEEPPPNVVFILATTDPSRLPATIVSRCQRFDFHLLTVEQIRMRLEQVLEEEKWHAEGEAVDLIARLAEGSLRDALGIVEQCAAYGDERITAEQVRIVTGATKSDYIDTIVSALVDNDLDSGLSMIKQIVYSGRDLQLFQRDLTYVFSRLLLAGSLNDRKKKISTHGYDQIIDKQRGNIDQTTLLDLVELLHETGAELRHAHFPQYIMEIMFIRMVRLLHGRLKPSDTLHYGDSEDKSKAAGDGQAVTAKKKEPEKTAAATALKSSQDLKKLQSESDKPKEDSPREVHADEGGISADQRFDALKEAWPRLLNEIKKRQKTTAAWLEPAQLTGCTGRRVIVTYAPEYQVHQARLMGDNHRKLVEAVLTAFCREDMELKAELGQVEVERKPSAEEEPVQSNAPVPENIKQFDEEEKIKPPTKEKEKKRSGVEEAIDIFGGKVIDTDDKEEH